MCHNNLNMYMFINILNRIFFAVCKKIFFTGKIIESCIHWEGSQQWKYNFVLLLVKI